MRQPGEYTSLFRNYLNNKSTAEELEELFYYFGTSKEEDLRMLILLELEKEESTGFVSEETRQHVDALYSGIADRINKKSEKTSWLMRFTDLRMITAAAAAVLLILLFTLHLQRGGEERVHQQKLAKTDIAPGGNKAVLTLPDGRKIVLDDARNGQLAKTSGISVMKTKDGQIVYRADKKSEPSPLPGQENSIATPRGGQFQVILPDGTRAWLNAASEIRFPSYFGTQKRSVEVKGEAYFEVAKAYDPKAPGKRIPFIVRTKYQDIEVLGTHFNVNAYEDESETRTTLVEGRVAVYSRAPGKSPNLSEAILKPGQEAVNNHVRHSLSVQKAETEDVMAWKNGMFSFNDADIGTIMRQVSRWYNVEVVYQGNVQGKQFSGFVSRYEKVSQVLEILESTGAIHFKIEERRITVMP